MNRKSKTPGKRTTKKVISKPQAKKKVPVPKDLDPIVEVEKNQPLFGVAEIPEGGTFQIIDKAGNVRSDINHSDGFHYYTLGADIDENLKKTYVGMLRRKGYSRCEMGTVENRSLPGAEIWRIPEEKWAEQKRNERPAIDPSDELQELADESAHFDGEVDASMKVTKTQLAATRK